MLSKLVLIAFLFSFILKSYVTFSFGDVSEQTNLTRVVRQIPLFDAINSLVFNVKTFFGRKSKIFEEKRKRVKNAFELLFQELNKKRDLLKPGKTYAEDEELVPFYALPKLKNYSEYKTPKIKFTIKPEHTAEHMITANGYRTEIHTVLTKDGYMITMQRLLPQTGINSKRAVLMHHGIYGSSEDWLLLGKEKALPYMLTDNGFDVWLLNARGNRYSRMHINRNPNRQEFWDYSWHEIGLYDLPAVITYILEMTQNAQLNFIGHSMGATALLVLLSSEPEYNLILRSAILMAPMVFMYHAKGPIRALADFYRKNGQASLNFLGQTHFIKDDRFPEQIVDKFCKGPRKTCENPLLLLACGGKEHLTEELMEDIHDHVPAGGSVKTIIHYVQLVNSGFFQMFDYGDTVNLKVYGNSTPPLYDLKNVTLPMALFTSPSDWLSTVLDVQTLLPILQDVYVHHILKTDDFGHLDFLWSPDAPELIYNFVLSILDRILPGTELPPVKE